MYSKILSNKEVEYMKDFKEYNKAIINGKTRILYVKANTRSTNPIIYIKHNGDMMTYKQFLKHKKNKGGGRNIKKLM
jgi:hypothetical protein